MNSNYTHGLDKLVNPQTSNLNFNNSPVKKQEPSATDKFDEELNKLFSEYSISDPVVNTGGGNVEDDEDDESDTNLFSDDADNINIPDSLIAHTQEQEKRNYISSVMNEMGASKFNLNLEDEKREEAKSMMIEQIDFLRNSLEQDGVNISRIQTVDMNSSYEVVESTLRILQYKMDRNSYTSFAEEVLMMGVYGLEELFDGKKTYFNKYKPDLSGWHNQVNVKLRRMRHDTFTLVSNFVEHFNISTWMRLLLELIPNAIIYSRNRHQQYAKNNSGMYREDVMSAMNKLRDLE